MLILLFKWLRVPRKVWDLRIEHLANVNILCFFSLKTYSVMGSRPGLDISLFSWNFVWIDFAQVIAIDDIIRTPKKEVFNDIYELMDTKLHQIIRSDQALTEGHCTANIKVFRNAICDINYIIFILTLTIQLIIRFLGYRVNYDFFLMEPILCLWR